jgi:iron complex outermembrane receptor protein
MEHVLVSVPLHKTSAETALPITVLTGEKLQREVAATLGDTLNTTPGLANASFGPGVGQPVIRGQQGARVTVLQNGTRSADASSLSGDHAVAVEPMLADSIEILRGPSTLLYGGGAIGGVVNVRDNRVPTQLPEEASGGVEYRHDSAADTDSVVFRADGAVGNLALHIDGLYRDWNNLNVPGSAVREEDHEEHEGEHEEEHEGEHEGEEAGRRGVIDNTDGLTKSLTLGGAYHFDSGFVGLAVSRLENNYGIPAGAHAPHEEEHEGEEHEEEHEGEEEHEEEHGHGEGGIRIDLEQTRYDLNGHWHEPLAGIEVARAFVTYTDYEHREVEGSGEIGTEFSNETWEGRLELVHQQMGNFHGVFGLQASAGEFSALGEEAFVPVTDSQSMGVFLVEDYHSGDWTFEGGLRFDWDERDPEVGAKQDFNSFSASASALWDISTEFRAGLALSRAERAPTTEELYSNVGITDPEAWVVHAATNAIELGDDSLDTEVSNNADLSFVWAANGHHIDVTVFYNDFSDYINLLNTGQEVDEVPVLVYSQQDAEFYGVEIDSAFALGQLAGGELRLEIFGDAIRGELDDGSDIPRLPPMRIGGALRWSGESLQLWTRVVEADDQDRPGENEEETEGYTRWDAGVEYRLANFDIFVTARNLGDEEIRLSTSFLRDVAPEAGRSIEAGVRYTF